jgi:hypothetical protein
MIKHTHRLHIRQWWDMGGLNVWHWLHMLSFSFLRCNSVGTALMGTDPGSVKLVLAWHAKARAHNIQYKYDKETGMPPVLAKNVTVTAEYTKERVWESCFFEYTCTHLRYTYLAIAIQDRPWWFPLDHSCSSKYQHRPSFQYYRPMRNH